MEGHAEEQGVAHDAGRQQQEATDVDQRLGDVGDLQDADGDAVVGQRVVGLLGPPLYPADPIVIHV